MIQKMLNQQVKPTNDSEDLKDLMAELKKLMMMALIGLGILVMKVALDFIGKMGNYYT